MEGIFMSRRQEAKAAYLKAVNDAVAEVKELPALDDAQRKSLRLDVRRSCRPHALIKYYSRLWIRYSFGGAIFLTIAAGFGTHAWVTHWSKRLDSWGIVGGIVLGFFIFALLPLATKMFSGKYRRQRIFRYYMLLTLLTYVGSLIALSLKHDFWITVLAGCAIFPICFLLASLIELVFSYKESEVQRLRLKYAYSAAGLAMLETAALVSRNRNDWQSSKVSRLAIREIEGLARKVQDELSLSSRIGRWHPDVFSPTAIEAARVAQTVRLHKKLIACASGESDFENVAASLSNGAQALLANKRSKLLEGAPEAVLKQRVNIVLRHLFPVVLLISAAILLPLAPPISGEEKIADSIRLTLLLAGVLALISPRSESSAKILDVVGKAIPGK
ncbi:hypothetical protein [Streptomyces sp. NPDC055105]|uniref:hypothetical protein n=1 Tax=Streptomyces sp. NPDC055105 TaxID=3365719 RepID=UPI0037D0A9F1